MIEGALMQRTLPDGRILALMPLTLGRARLTLGQDEDTYQHGW